MGGRGAMSGGGFRAPSGYRTIRTSNGIPILQGHKGKGLPFKGRPNQTWGITDRNGKMQQFREYDKHGNAKRDVDWGHTFKEDGKRYPAGTPHMHDWNGTTRGLEHIKIPDSMRKKIEPHLKDMEGIQWLM